ncbi:3'-5' exonuclease domain-containing protein [Citrus sinensis]|uniref:3'-5' exonuclease domain-containing protein n=1 Tax=Citrus sinensis TaxID=2711 RepID=A0ACB8K2T4_CITSI|nr:3'-5' exonuclease domain-containing protein [Citrus sinensis]
MAISISKHEVQYNTHDEYTVHFYDDVVFTQVTRSPSVVDDWISEIERIHRRRLHCLIVGLDVEWRPSFSRQQNPVATLQLCVGRRCLIFQIIHARRIPQSLANFLSDEDYTFVGVGIDGDVKKLENNYGLQVFRTVDLRPLAAEDLEIEGLRFAGLKALSWEVLEKEVNKPRNITLSAWDTRVLTPAQPLQRKKKNFPLKQAKHTNKMTISIYDHQLPYESHNRYDVTFFDNQIRTVVTTEEDPVDEWVSDIERVHRNKLPRLIVGLDLEWRPSFSRVQNPVAIIQLCVGRRCLIFQLIHAQTIPRSLVGFLSTECYSFVGVGIKKDLEKLEDFYGITVQGNVVELGRLAGDRKGRTDLVNAGLKNLAREVLGLDFEKPRRVTMSRWDKRWLDPAQVQYACIDSFVSFELGRVLRD